LTDIQEKKKVRSSHQFQSGQKKKNSLAGFCSPTIYEKGRFMRKQVKQRRPVRVIEGFKAYLVRLDSSLFYLRTSGDGKPLGVNVPSAAWHGSYADADEICQRFRAMGYTGPAVCDIYGRLVDNESLEAERQIQANKANKFWGE